MLSPEPHIMVSWFNIVSGWIDMWQDFMNFIVICPLGIIFSLNRNSFFIEKYNGYQSVLKQGRYTS